MSEKLKCFVLLCFLCFHFSVNVNGQPHCIFPKRTNSTEKIVCYGSEEEMRAMLNGSVSSRAELPSPELSSFATPLPYTSPTAVSYYSNNADPSLSNHKLNVDPIQDDKLESRAFPTKTIIKRNRIHFVEPEQYNNDDDDSYDDDDDENSDDSVNPDKDSGNVQDEPPKRIFLKRIPSKPHSILVPVSENNSGFQKPYVTYYHPDKNIPDDSEPQYENHHNVDERRIVIRKEGDDETETRFIKAPKAGSYEPEASEYYHGYVPYEAPGQYYSNPIYKESAPYPHHPPPHHHRYPVEHHVIYEERPMSSYWISKLKNLLLLKGISTKALFLATLPLLLGPLLSYLATPVVIPITANVAAGRRRRRRAIANGTSDHDFLLPNSHLNITQILRMLNDSQHFNNDTA